MYVCFNCVVLFNVSLPTFRHCKHPVQQGNPMKKLNCLLICIYVHTVRIFRLEN